MNPYGTDRQTDRQTDEQTDGRAICITVIFIALYYFNGRPLHSSKYLILYLILSYLDAASRTARIIS